MKVLVIDDDVETVNHIRSNLISNLYTVDVAYDGAKGSYIARTNPYDVIIVDYSLPDKNGITVCSEIRSSGSLASILFISINQTVENKVACLEAGADDYMTKPFALEELNARIKALLRRPRKIENHILAIDDLVLDTKKQTIKKAGNYFTDEYMPALFKHFSALTGEEHQPFPSVTLVDLIRDSDFGNDGFYTLKGRKKKKKRYKKGRKKAGSLSYL